MKEKVFCNFVSVRKWMAMAVIVLVLSLGVSPAMAATPLENNRHIFISVANDAGVKYDWDGAYYSGPAGTYYIKADGGGLNELHITNDNTSGYGQVTASNAQSGVFYVSNTGGRGFDNDIILLLSVKGPIPDDFAVRVKSSGYDWTPAAAGAYTPAVPADYAYVADALDETFNRNDFVYGPQTAKPGPGALGTWSLPLYYGQDIADSSTAEYLMFVDLYAGNLYPTKVGTTLENSGAVKVEYSFTNLTTHASFNAYGWCSAANQDEGISWTNRMEDPGASAYTVNGMPFAAFHADVQTGTVPLTVQFTDESTGTAPMTYAWDFGDGATSTDQSPAHEYMTAGTYTVKLTVTDAVGSDTEEKAGYITVSQGVIPLPGCTDLPTDPDNDGIYEDLNGNGRMDFADVVLYFNEMQWIGENEPIDAFDLNGNDRIDFADIVALFNEI